MAGSSQHGALSKLVREILDRPGMNYAKLAETSVDPETKESISASWVHSLASGKLSRTPELRSLRALAVGTGLPVDVLKQAAAAQFLDYEVGELAGYPDDVKVIIGKLATLDPDELPRTRTAIEAVLDALRPKGDKA